MDRPRPTILIADDERSITDTLAAIFERRGFKAIRAYSGERAVELARRSPPNFAVLDIMMNGISGVEAAIKLRALCPECRIVLISGAMDSAELLAAASAQGHNFDALGKPIDPELLVRQLVGPDGRTTAGVPANRELLGSD